MKIISAHLGFMANEITDSVPASVKNIIKKLQGLQIHKKHYIVHRNKSLFNNKNNIEIAILGYFCRISNNI